MFSRIPLLLFGLLLSGQIVADDNLTSTQNLCHQSIPLIRDRWRLDLFDAPPAVAALMVNVIDGKLPQVRRQLAELQPDEIVRWRQSAMLTAVFTDQPAIADALLDDGAAVDGLAWLPPFKLGFYQQMVGQMKQDPRFGGPSAVNRLAAAGILKNQGQQSGPALAIAVQCGDVATVDVLLRHHADVMARTAVNVADALLVGVVQGNAVIVRRLLDHGADVCAEARHFHQRYLALKLTHMPRTLEQLGQRAGLPADLTARLACPAIASTY